jgi:uncharacterized protein YprB with RNaseH-like and TPR domain
MAVYIVLDLETIAHPDAAQWFDPVKPDARLKDPVKIEADIIEKTAEQLKTAALHPDTNRIVALGYYVVGHIGDPVCLLMRDELEERELLTQFGQLYRDLDRRNEVRLVSFNGLTFDYPTLIRRCQLLDAPLPEFSIDKYRSPHADFDVMWRLSFRGAIRAHSLKFYAKRLGLPLLDKVNGTQIHQLVAEERWDDVAAHCLSDVALTHAVANRMK